MQKPSWSRTAAEIAAVATRDGRARHGAFSIEGLRLFERALAARAPIRAALVAASAHAAPGERLARVLTALGERGVDVRVVPDDAFAERTDGRELGGVLGLVALPPPGDLDRLLSAHDRARLLVLCDVDDPGNVGALVRSALAGGALACVAVGVSDPWHPKAVRTSMGSVFRLPLVRAADFASLGATFARHGVTTWAAVARAGVACRDAPRGPRTALVVGSEAFGLPAAVARACDQRVSIPMPADVDSYSVNAAAAILLYELGRDALE